VSPSPPNTTITLYVDPNIKGQAADVGEVYLYGSWVALIHRPEQSRVEQKVLADVADRAAAEHEVKKHLEITKRRLTWERRGTAWVAKTRLG
jgi:hypothetical protein